MLGLIIDPGLEVGATIRTIDGEESPTFCSCEQK